MSLAVAAVGTLRPQEVVLEQQPPRARSAGPVMVGEAQIREYAAGHVQIEAAVDEPAIVVLSDAWMPGWTATVNGHPTPILHANVAFRAVEVPAGRSQIEFRYRTPGLTAGIAISCAAAAVIAGLAAWPFVRSRVAG